METKITSPGNHAANPMNTGSRSHKLLICVVVVVVSCCVWSSVALAQSPAASLTAEQIVARMTLMDAQRAAKEPRYRAVRHYTVDYKGFPGDKHAEMVVEVVANPPEKQFNIVSEDGSKFLLDRVLHKVVESEREASQGKNRRELKLNADNYDFQLIGMKTVHERPCYELEVQPKHANKFLYRGNVCVDAEDFAVTEISASPAKNPSFWTSSVEIKHEYQKQGGVWLPRSNQSTSKVRLGGRALLTIDYECYELANQPQSQAQNR